jgi:hypothetical protein
MPRIVVITGQGVWFSMVSPGLSVSLSDAAGAVLIGSRMFVQHHKEPAMTAQQVLDTWCDTASARSAPHSVCSRAWRAA